MSDLYISLYVKFYSHSEKISKIEGRCFQLDEAIQLKKQMGSGVCMYFVINKTFL